MNSKDGGRGRAGMPVISILFAVLAISPYNTIDRAATTFQQEQAPYPEGITEEKIAAGQALFAGEAGCHVCHGRLALGVPNWTSDLTDGEWLKAGGGTYEAIMAVVRNGVEPSESVGGVTMPPMGRKDLTDEQVEALAAYVWSINRKG